MQTPWTIPCSSCPPSCPPARAPRPQLTHQFNPAVIKERALLARASGERAIWRNLEAHLGAVQRYTAMKREGFWGWEAREAFAAANRAPERVALAQAAHERKVDLGYWAAKGVPGPKVAERRRANEERQRVALAQQLEQQREREQRQRQQQEEGLEPEEGGGHGDGGQGGSDWRQELQEVRAQYALERQLEDERAEQEWEQEQLAGDEDVGEGE